MIIRVNFGGNDDEFITCSAEIGDSINELREEFLKWIYDKNNDHKYWEYHKGKKYAVNYRTNAFIEWLNEIKFKNTDATATMIDPSLAVNVDKSINF